jgi:nucleoside-diphosphate-sugar epimerase
VTLDITDPARLADVFREQGPFDAVVHAAALAHVKPGEVAADAAHHVNAIGTKNVLDAATRANVGTFVYISSVMVYGDYDLPDVVSETSPTGTTGVYGAAKLHAEESCKSAPSGMRMYVLRMATMYAPNWLLNIRKRVRPLARGRPVYFTLDPDGRRYSLCSRRNGARAVLWAVEQRMPPDTYNVADDYQYSQREILRAVRGAVGPGPRIPIPMLLPRLMWHAVRLLVPSPRMRANAHSRYWKFCERNVYSADKLKSHGFDAPADLLTV